MPVSKWVSVTTLCLKKRVPTFELSVTLSHLNRFSKFSKLPWEINKIKFSADIQFITTLHICLLLHPKVLVLVRPKAGWAGVICCTHQHYHRQWLPNIKWSYFSRWACARDRWLWKERLWENEGFKARVKNAVRNVNNQSRIRAWWWRRAGWWWCSWLVTWCWVAIH